MSDIEFTDCSGVLPAKFNISTLFFVGFFLGKNPGRKEEMAKIKRRLQYLNALDLESLRDSAQNGVVLFPVDLIPQRNPLQIRQNISENLLKK